MPLPVQGDYNVTALFGPTGEPLDSGGFNKGIDIGVPVGTKISATTGGTVLSAGDSGDGWGTSVKVKDANGNIHNYGHLSDLNVAPGMQIPAGYWVANSGNTGKSTGPHLSYDVLGAGGSYIDPSPWLGFSAAGSNYGFSSKPLSTFGVDPTIAQGDASNWGAPVGSQPTSNWWEDDPATQTPSASMGPFTNYYDAQGNWVQRNETTGQITILKSASAAPAAGAPITKTINGATYQWNGSSWAPAPGLPTETASGGQYVAWMTRPDGTQVGYNPTNGQVLVEYADPGTWQTVNLGNGQVVQVNNKTGETRPITNPTSGPVIPNIASASSAGVWTQDPTTGELKWTATPTSGGLKPASSGQITYSGGGTRPSASSSSSYDPTAATKLQIAAQKELQAGQQAWQGAQNTTDRQLNLYRDVSGQRFTGGENAVDRNLSNAQFGANYGLNTAQLDLQRRQLGLQGAETYGRLVSTPDLAALPAFLQAGGGNVLNGLAGGADMITQNANTPAALALQQLRQPFAELPAYSYVPETNPNIPDAVPLPDLTSPAPAAAAAAQGGGRAARALRGLAGGGMVNDTMFMVGDRMDGRPTGTEEVVLNPTGAPLSVVPNSAQLPGMRRFATGTGVDLTQIGPQKPYNAGKAIMDGTPLSPGMNAVNFTDGSTGWVQVGANGSIVDESGAPVGMGANTIDPRGGTVSPIDYTDNTPGPSAPALSLPRGYTAVDPAMIPKDRLGPAGTQWTYAHNPTTGKVVRIAPDGKQFGMYSTTTPPGEKGVNVLGPKSTMGAILNSVGKANRSPTPGIAQRDLNQGVYGSNPYGFEYNPASLSRSRPSPFGNRGTTGQLPGPTTTPQVDTPAGTVNPGTGAVSGDTPATPATQAQQDNSLAANIQTVEDFRREFKPAVAWNPMAANYLDGWDPNERDIAEMGQQTKYGTPVSTLRNQAYRMRLPGVSRSNLSLGV